MKMKIVFGAGIIILLLFILYASLYHLEDSPKPWFDEGLYIHIARTLAEDGVYGFRITPNIYGDVSYISVGYPVIFPLALLFKVVEPTIFSARILSVLWLYALYIVSFLYVQHKYGKWHAFVALAAIATFSPLFGNGKNVLGEIPGLVLLISSLFMLEYSQEREWRTIPLVLSGFLAGLAAAAKPTFLPFLGIYAVSMVIIFLRRKVPFRSLLLCASAALLSFLAWIFSQFLSVSEWSGVLAHYSNPYNDPNPWLNTSTNFLRFFTEDTPIHFMAFFIFSAFLIYFFRRKIKLTEWILFFYIISIYISFLKSPGWYRYFFPAHVLVLLLVPMLLSYVHFNYLNRKIYITLVTCLVIFQGYHTVKYIDQMYSSEWRSVRDVVHGESGVILFYNVPEGPFFSTSDMYYQVLTIRDGLTYGEENLKHLGQVDMIITRDSELDLSRIKKEATGFKEAAHIGNYYIFKK